jgi:superfamily II DNA/RNA helicase
VVTEVGLWPARFVEPPRRSLFEVLIETAGSTPGRGSLILAAHRHPMEFPYMSRPVASAPSAAPTSSGPSAGRRRAGAGRSRSNRGPRPAGTHAARTPSASSALEAALVEALRADVPAVASFAELGLPPRLVEALQRRGLERPFAIQARALPDALAGRDVLGRAATGSGKTLAFGLPILVRLAGGRPSAPGAPRALVLVPSRELALQVTATLTPLARALNVKVTTVVGGTGYGRQIDALAGGADVVVATPGRLVDLIERGSCTLGAIETVAVDEADYMADLGFLPVVTRLLRDTPAGGQRLLFSATLDKGVAGLVEAFLDRPAVHAVAPATAAVTAMTHRLFLVHRDDKVEVAAQVAARPARTLFFVRTKHGADRLARNLGRAGVDAAALHGNLAQNARERVVAEFAAGRTRVLVATDVAARGLHIDDVDLVVHFDPPADHKAYLHRSGRTARAGNDGTVVAFVQADQLGEVRALHRDAAVEAVVESVSPGHRAVIEMGASGEPVIPVPAPAPRTSSASAGSGTNRPGRRRGRRRPAA